MKGLGSFLKTMVVGGFFVVLPVAVLVLVIMELDSVVYGLLSPVAELFPDVSIGGVNLAHVLAAVLILFVFFATGWIAQTTIGSAVQKSFEKSVLMKFPGYAVLKSLSTRFSGEAAMDERFAPGAVTVAEGTRVVGVITEEHDDDYVMYFPFTPTPGVGSLQFIRKDKVEKLDTSISAVVTAYSQFGVGSAGVFSGGKKKPDVTQ